jgi:hypothetical protein
MIEYLTDDEEKLVNKISTQENKIKLENTL